MKYIRNFLSKLHLFFVRHNSEKDRQNTDKQYDEDKKKLEELKEDVYFWRNWEKFEWKLHFRVAEKFGETIHSNKWKRLSEEEKLEELRYIIYTFPSERRKIFNKEIEFKIKNLFHQSFSVTQ